MKRVVTGIMVILWLTSVLPLALNIQPAKAIGIIYIRADGSIDPPTANITTIDSVTYTFTDNINDSIVVQRNDIVIDGAGCVLHGAGDTDSRGIDLSDRTNVTVKNIQVENFWHGIFLYSSFSNSISNNNITNSWDGIALTFSFSTSISANDVSVSGSYGIWVWESDGSNIAENSVSTNYAGIALDSSFSNSISNNIITANEWTGISLENSSNNSVDGNTITKNGYGIIVWESSSYNIVSGNNMANNGYGVWFDVSYDNRFYHNYFTDNYAQVNASSGYYNVWDDGYPSGGNYWSDYSGVDVFNGLYQNETGSDGIGDVPYVIDENNTDRYPLMPPYVPNPADINQDGTVDMSDAILVASAFGSYPTYPNWNSLVDLNQDDVIDIFDIIILATNFGRH